MSELNKGELKLSAATPFSIGAVSVFIYRDGKVLLGKRIGSHGAGEYAAPGGKIDKYRAEPRRVTPEYAGRKLMTIYDTALKEVGEECGPDLRIKIIGLICLSEDLFPDNCEAFLNACLLAEYVSGEAVASEPDKCLGWDWYDTDTLPQPIFPSTERAIRAKDTGQFFFPADPQNYARI